MAHKVIKQIIEYDTKDEFFKDEKEMCSNGMICSSVSVDGLTGKLTAVFVPEKK